MSRKSMSDVLSFYKAVILADNNVYANGKWGQFINGKQAFDCICIIKACGWNVPVNADITKVQYQYIAANKNMMPDVSVTMFYSIATEKGIRIADIPKDKLSFVYVGTEHIGLYDPTDGEVYECCAGSQMKTVHHPLNYYDGTPAEWNRWSNGAYFSDSYIVKDTEPSKDEYLRVQAGAFTIKANAVRRAKEIQDRGYDAIIKLYNGHYRVQVGAYKVRSNAEAMLNKIRKAGYEDAFITSEGGTDVQIKLYLNCKSSCNPSDFN